MHHHGVLQARGAARQTTLKWAQRTRDEDFVIRGDAEGRIVAHGGYVIPTRGKGVNNLRARLDPAHAELAPYLVGALLHEVTTASPGHRIDFSVPQWMKAVVTAAGQSSESSGGGSLSKEIRVELEATRQAYHVLLGSLSDEDWRQPSGNSAWTVGRLMVHITFAPRMLPADVGLIRRGGWMPKLPAFLFNWSNVLMTRWAARKETVHTVGALYDAAHDNAVGVLETIQDEEWSLGREYPDWDPMLSGYVTLERLFRYLTIHFEVHEEQVRQGLADTAQISEKE